MTPERFTQIVDAYGANPKNWPRGEREAAKAYAESAPDQCRPMLEGARALDVWLAGHVVEPAGDALMTRIIASAPQARGRPLLRRRLIWPGLGLAGIGLAGALAGALVMAVLLPAMSPSFGHDGAFATAFDSMSPDADDQELQ